MNYAQIRKFDIANSQGISSSIFFSGCTHKCNGCFNSIAQDFNYGQPYTVEVEEKFIKCLQHPQVRNACILGGEPFQQELSILLNLVKRIKEETNVQVWVWTGYLFEDIINNKEIKKILEYVDILIDGRFILELKDLSLKHRGSSNQRVIDVQESLKENKIILSKHN